MSEKHQFHLHTLLRGVVHFMAWLPLLWMILGWVQNDLGADPIRAIMLRTGKTALIFLWLSLSCTPLFLLFGWTWVRPLRREFGLYSFFYASLHVLNFLWLDYGWDTTIIFEDMFQKPYALFGAASFFILLPMAITSWKWAFSALGPFRWKKLHQFGYLAAILAAAHYILLVKQAYAQPVLFIAVLILLFVVRFFLQKRNGRGAHHV